MLTKEDKILIKNLGESKKYGSRKLIKEFPNKNWSKRGLDDFLRRLRETGTIERAPGSGRPCTTRTAENIDAVEELVAVWRIFILVDAVFISGYKDEKFIKIG